MIAQDYERGENGGAKRSGSWNQTRVNSSCWPKKPLDVKEAQGEDRRVGSQWMEGSEWKEGGVTWRGLAWSPVAWGERRAGGQWTVPGATGSISAWLRYLGPENKFHWGREEGFIQKKR